MKITITRREILKAIRTENLGYKGFYKGTRKLESPFLIVGKTCTVCAVGAVLRSRLKGLCIYDAQKIIHKTQNLSVWTSANEDTVTGLLKAKQYLAALSSKFEKADIDAGDKTYRWTKPRREKFCEWITENIPVSFKVNWVGPKRKVG